MRTPKKLQSANKIKIIYIDPKPNFPEVYYSVLAPAHYDFFNEPPAVPAHLAGFRRSLRAQVALPVIDLP